MTGWCPLRANLKPSLCRHQLVGQVAHESVLVRFALEADADKFRHGDVSGLNPDPVGKAPERLEKIRETFIATQAEACGYVERHLEAAVRDAAP